MKYVSKDLIEKLKESFPEAVENVEEFRGEISITVKKGKLLEVMRFLKVEPAFEMDMLVDLTAVDFPDKNPRFTVVYHLRSLKHRHNLRVKCPAENNSVPSVFDIWKTAEWTEREVFEMFGIEFSGRENRKLLLPQKYPHYPLRKDFPLEGYEDPCEVWDWE